MKFERQYNIIHHVFLHSFGISKYFRIFAPEIEYVRGTTVPFFVLNIIKMIIKDSVTQIVESYLSDSDYYLVDVKISADNRISVEIDRFEGVSIEYCSRLSKAIENKLDRDVEDYELEVSSAGLTEPFKVLKQYEKNMGNEVEVLTKEGKKLIGILTGFTNQNITLEIETQLRPEGAKRKITVKEEKNLPFSNIKTTKYIIRFK